MSTLHTGFRFLFTPEPPFPVRGQRMGRLRVVERAAVLLEGERIRDVGPEEELRRRYPGVRECRWDGFLALPGIIDAHTHPVFAGSRAKEYHLRLKGASYLEILRKGGGILSTVRVTRAAEDSALALELGRRLAVLRAQGVRAIEGKSGYALEAEGELRLLRLLREAGGEVAVAVTFLGAHAVPPEFGTSAEYLAYLEEEVLPRVRGRAEFVDIFCEEGVFSVEESARFLGRAKALGFSVKLHADELKRSGGTRLAGDLGAISVDHCIFAEKSDFQYLAEKSPETVVVLLPATSYFLKKPFARARDILECDLPVALGSDLNPGTSFCLDPWWVAGLAVHFLGLSPEETLTAMTANAAHASGLTEFGALLPGFRGPFLAVRCPFVEDGLQFLGYYRGPLTVRWVSDIGDDDRG